MLADVDGAEPWSYTYNGYSENVDSGSALCRTVASTQCKDCMHFAAGEYGTLKCDSVPAPSLYAGQLLFISPNTSSPALPECTPMPNHCHKNHLAVQSLDNGQITPADGQDFSTMTGDDGFACGVSVDYTCNTCYQPSVAGVTQSIGYTYSTVCEKYTTTGDYTDSSSVSCVKAACPSTDIAHGTATLASGTANVCGASYTFSCDTCYQRSGDKTVACSTDATSAIWSPAKPVCNVAECTALPVTKGTVAYSNNYHCLSTATVTCDSCYELDGSVTQTMSCGVQEVDDQDVAGWIYNGALTSEAVCTKQQTWCSDPPAPPPYSHRTWDSSTQKSCGSTATYTCGAGFMLALDGEIQYSFTEYVLECDSTSGSWCYNGTCTLQTLSCEPVKCQLTSTLQPTGDVWGGTVSLTTDSSNTDGVGAVYSITCNTCFDVTSSSAVVCESTGQWNDTWPTCTSQKCTALNNSMFGGNGAWVYEQGGAAAPPDPDEATCQTNATATCNSCYALNRNDLHATCTMQSSGSPTFIGNTTGGSCSRIPDWCSLDLTLENGNVTVTSDSYDASEGFRCEDVVTYKCDSCYDLVAANGSNDRLHPIKVYNRTCSAPTGGAWTGTDVTCEITNCPALDPVGDGHWECSTTATANGGYSCGTTCTLQCDKTVCNACPMCH